jgi:hypothetical protein
VVSLTAEQKLVKRVIEDATDRGISMVRIRRLIPQEVMPPTMLRKNITELEKIGLIKQFKAVSVSSNRILQTSCMIPDRRTHILPGL